MGLGSGLRQSRARNRRNVQRRGKKREDFQFLSTSSDAAHYIWVQDTAALGGAQVVAPALFEIQIPDGCAPTCVL
jgi:hypothetical protein